MSKVVLLITVADMEDGEIMPLSIVAMSDLDPEDYEAIAALALRACLDKGGSLKETLKLIKRIRLDNPSEVPEPMVLG